MLNCVLVRGRILGRYYYYGRGSASRISMPCYFGLNMEKELHRLQLLLSRRKYTRKLRDALWIWNCVRREFGSGVFLFIFEEKRRMQVYLPLLEA